MSDGIETQINFFFVQVKMWIFPGLFWTNWCTRMQVLFWKCLTCSVVLVPKTKTFSLNFLVGPKGPGGTSIPNNYCNKCQGSIKKTGKTGSPFSTCHCKREYTKVFCTYKTSRFCVFHHVCNSAVLCASRPRGGEGRRDFYRSGGAVRHHFGERHLHLPWLWGGRAGRALRQP